MTSKARPRLRPGMNEEEFRRWYWTKEELTGFARRLGLSATGAKEKLAARIADRLAGRSPAPAAPRRPSPRGPLPEPLSRTTALPEGQRCTQQLRAYFERELGASFRFDGPMRDFIAASRGDRTLGDALTHYARTRERGPTTIAPQFELNRFTRKFFAENPNASREDLRAAWEQYRSTPLDRRRRV